jgi:CubicO group peptidase (beta-lactamase class C family)
MRTTLIAAACAALLAACAAPAPSSAGLDAARLADIDRVISSTIAAQRMPGAVYHLERAGMQVERAYGRQSYLPDAPLDTPATVFDIASLTKVVATAPAVLMLADEGRIDLDAPLTSYFPECAGGGRDTITIRHLLTHTSGLPSGLPALPAWQGGAAAHALACARVPSHTPGTYFRYSDVNFILLGQLVEQVARMPLAQFAQARIFAPLRMRNTGYLPLARHRAGAIAPTAQLENGLLQGVVHDPTARRMDGVAGSAGVFSTAADLARYARMLLAGGTLDGVRVLSPASVALLTTDQSPPGVAAHRAMGMDIDSAFARPRGSVFPVGSYGHTGFTGCVLWIDPHSRTFYVFLSNRVFPDEKSNIVPLYGELGTLSALAAAVK